MFKVECFEINKEIFVIRHSKTGKRWVLENIHNGKTKVFKKREHIGKLLMVENTSDLVHHTWYSDNFKEYKEWKELLNKGRKL